MLTLTLEDLAVVAGGAKYLCMSNGFHGEPVIPGDRSPTLDGAKQTYSDRCKANGNSAFACWLNRNCAQIGI